MTNTGLPAAEHTMSFNVECPLCENYCTDCGEEDPSLWQCEVCGAVWRIMLKYEQIEPPLEDRDG